MINSMIRSTMNTAFCRPSAEIRRKPSSARMCSPGVKNRFKMPVNTMMNTTGFSPRTRDLIPTREMRTHTASTAARMP